MNVNPVKMTSALSNKLANMAFVCSILVVFIHTRGTYIDGGGGFTCESLLLYGLCRIAVPFFFIASGFLLAGHCDAAGWWRQACVKRIKTLALPYLIWNTLFLLFSCSLIIASNTVTQREWTSHLPSLSFCEILNLYGVSTIEFPYYGLLWFIRVLIALVLASKLFVWIITHLRQWSLLYLCVLFCLEIFLYSLDWQKASIFHERSYRAILMFNIGIYLRLYAPKIIVKKGLAVFLFGLGMVGFWKFLCLKDVGILVPESIQVFAILCVLIAVWVFIPVVEWRKDITSCAFPIFLLHKFILVTYVFFRKLIPAEMWVSGFVEYLLSGCLATILCLCLAMQLHKRTPRLSAALFGGR